MSISRPGKLFTRETATGWVGSVLEILVVIVLAIAAFIAAGSVYAEHETARTLLTTVLLVLDPLFGFAMLVWAILCIPSVEPEEGPRGGRQERG